MAPKIKMPCFSTACQPLLHKVLLDIAAILQWHRKAKNRASIRATGVEGEGFDSFDHDR